MEDHGRGMDTESKIRAYIVDSFLLGDAEGFDNTASLLESGTMDSTGVIELVEFLETTFAIQVADEELIPENLDAVRDIAAFVERKLASGPAEKRSVT